MTAPMRPAPAIRPLAWALLALVLLGCNAQAPDQGGGADLIIHGAEVWTADAEKPRVRALAVTGERIEAVGDAGEILALAGPRTRIIELEGGLVVPGFIDNHTHFNRAGELLLGINLLDVAEAEGLVERVRGARDRLPEDGWILGGDWGAYEAWEQGSPGPADADAPPEPFRPDRALIDPVTPDTPVLLWNWDRSAWLANARALEAGGLDCGDAGVECIGGESTGRLSPATGGALLEQVPEKSFEQRLAEARLALERLRSRGVTGIHDITPPEQFRVFQALHEAGELTLRVYARPTLDKWQALADVGIGHGFGDEHLKLGGLKGFVDGIMGNSTARFYEPYLHTGERGRWREMMQPPERLQEMLIGADSAGHWPQVHAIGDEAIDTLLDLYERMIEVNGPAERRLRVIHTQVLRGPEVARRMAGMRLIAEMQPYHAIDDMRWMEERIGERARWAYAFRTLDEAGVMLSFGSDWPGTNASWYPVNPMKGVYAAVTRKTLDGHPEGGWYPEERIDVDTALRAFTINNARAAGEEDLKGSLAPGKLADIVVLDADPFELPAGEIRHIGVRYTILGGRVIYRAGDEP